MNREPSGVARIQHKGRNVVAADAITLLSGVNFNSVVKVLAAVEALRAICGTTPVSLVSFSDVPLDRCLLNSPQDEGRAAATRDLCEHVAARVESRDLIDVMHLRGRFATD